MKVVVMFRESSEERREAESWKNDVERWGGVDVKWVDPDSAEGEGFVETYSIMKYPAVLILKEDGEAVQTWQGELPLIDTVVYWAKM